MRNAIRSFQIPAPLQTLYDAAAAIGPQFGLSPEAVLGTAACGWRSPVPSYIGWCTPRNVMTFATTGCDSVHYSYLVDERLPGSVCPIVMTLPCVNELSWVIAENFQEFFDYGYYVGWRELEQLYYEDEKGEACFHEASQSLNNLGMQQLPLLHKALNMQAVLPTLQRFGELQKKYQALLNIPPMPPEHA
jgi:hypothetical protein